MKKESIIMIGPLPPPVGGVSIHVSRLIEKLVDFYYIHTINTSQKNLGLIFRLIKLFFLSLFNPSKFFIHNHTFNIKVNLIILMLCKLFRIDYIQTLHSFRFEKEKLSKRDVKRIEIIIKNSYKIIVVNSKIKNDLLKFDSKAFNKITVLPAFIPYQGPVKSKNEFIRELKIDKFINSHEIILCANASKIEFHNSQDLYGIDLCIELMKELTNRNVGLVFMLPHIGNEDYYYSMKNRIKEYGLGRDFLFVNKQVDLVPLFESVDIFLRPTNTDGDAISIREALYSGVPTIASNIVERPRGTRIFKNRDLLDLYEKVLEVILNIENEREKVKELYIHQDNLIEKYFSIYK